MTSKPPQGPLWAVVAGCVALLLGMAGGFMIGRGTAPPAAEAQADAPGGGGPPPAMVEVGIALMQPLEERLAVTGRLRELRRVTVTAEVAGKLIALNVEEGDRVVGGETVLARIDPTWTDLRVRAAEADLDEARANLEQSERELVRLERLRAQRTANQRELDDAQTAVIADRARVAAAEAELSRATVEQERLAVVAPFDATVTAKNAEVGQWVEPGDGVVGLVSVGQIDAEVDVPETAINAVARLAADGTPVTITIDALGRDVTGQVAAVTPDGSSASRTFPVKVRLDDAEGLLKPGMSVTARFPLGEPRPTLTVPRDAVLFSTLTPQVWVAMDAGPPPGNEASQDASATPPASDVSDQAPPPQPMPFALPASVRVLYGQGDRFAIEVLDGPLFPGATVIIEGGESLFPTRPLMFDAPPASTPPDATAHQISGDRPA
ncbi:MAG: efflux RND transporter periplasmic adaptor subunit [Planctomycetota bacterium]